MRYDQDDPFIPIWEGPYIDAELIRLRIEEAHIPVDFGDALLPGQARVEVPRSYLEEVRDLLGGQSANWPSVTTLTDDGFDWKPMVRLAFIAMAAVGIILILFAYS